MDFRPAFPDLPIGFNIQVKNCKILFEENRDSKDLIGFSYFLTKLSFKWERASITHYIIDNTILLEAFSSKTELKNCHLEIKVPSLYNIDLLDIKCVEHCVVVSNLPNMRVNNAILQGSHLFANFR
jgi:hypothetical protein